MKRGLLLIFVILSLSKHLFSQKNFTLEIKSSQASEIISKLSYKKSFVSITERDKEIQNVFFSLFDNAYLTASIDSVIIDSLKENLTIKTGEQFKWANLKRGNADEGILSEAGFREKIYSGKPFYYKDVRKLQEKILSYCENNGYPFASVKLDSIVIAGSSFSASLNLQKNILIKIDSVVNRGGAKISDIYLQSYLGIRNGNLYSEELIKKIGLRLKELPFVKERIPYRILFPGENAKVELFLEKKRASQFDGILGLLPEELEREFAAMGAPAYRARQVFSWLHQKGAARFDQMTDLPAAFRQQLAARYAITQWTIRTSHQAHDGSLKWLLEAPDGSQVETVLMRAGTRRTQCISTQVGCKFGCKFCASGLFGFVRHLRADEIVAEVLLAARETKRERPSHLVVMGMGEPFDNYGHLVRALRILNQPLGIGLGKRRITISTVGLPRKILAFAEEGLPVELSVSLHSAIDEVRGQIMPVNRAFPVAELLDACWTYMRKTNRLITFEYILIDGVNADAHDAEALIRALRGHPAKVNLIPYNPIAEFPAQRPSLVMIRSFQHRLRAAHIPTTVRFSKGGEVEAACGQLRLHEIESKKKAGG